jgi:hypothetical protein
MTLVMLHPTSPCTIDSSTKLFLETIRSFALEYAWRRCFTEPVEECLENLVNPVHGAGGVVVLRFFMIERTTPTRVTAAPANSAT